MKASSFLLCLIASIVVLFLAVASARPESPPGAQPPQEASKPPEEVPEVSAVDEAVQPSEEPDPSPWSWIAAWMGPWPVAHSRTVSIGAEG